MRDEIIAIRGMNGQIQIAVREPDHHQFPALSPPRYVARAEVWDANDIGDIAQAFGWIPQHEPACPECGTEMYPVHLASRLDDRTVSRAYCKNCGYKEEDDEE